MSAGLTRGTGEVAAFSTDALCCKATVAAAAQQLRVQLLDWVEATTSEQQLADLPRMLQHSILHDSLASVRCYHPKSVEWAKLWPYLVNIHSQAMGSALPHAVLPGAKAFARGLVTQVEDGRSL